MPLNKNQYKNQEREKFRVSWHENREDRQGEQSESIVPFVEYREDYLRSQRLLLEQEKEQRSVMLRDPGT
jgi:hypothetical protein